MKSLIFVFAALTAMSVLSGCSLGKDSAAQNTVLLRQNKEVNELYGPLTGTYEGKMTNTNHGDEDIELIIYITNEGVTNPDGTPGSKDVPYAYFRRNNPVIADYQMDVSGYTREAGDVSFRNKGNESDVRSVRAHISDGLITGPVINLEGTLGVLNLHFVSKDTNSRNDARDRLLRRYQAVQGEYVGVIPARGNRGKVRHISVSLSASLVGDTPRIDGFYKNLDVPDGEVDLPLTVSYRPDMSPPQITMNGKGAGKYALDFNGTLIGNTMVVDVNSPFYEGFLGTATLNKKR